MQQAQPVEGQEQQTKLLGPDAFWKSRSEPPFLPPSFTCHKVLTRSAPSPLLGWEGSSSRVETLPQGDGTLERTCGEALEEQTQLRGDQTHPLRKQMRIPF